MKQKKNCNGKESQDQRFYTGCPLIKKKEFSNDGKFTYYQSIRETLLDFIV